jgi:hypothetical protein
MSRALIVRKALVSTLRVSSVLMFFVSALAFGSLLCMVVADVGR